MHLQYMPSPPEEDYAQGLLFMTVERCPARLLYFK